jgi:predicted enzyme related to lactoylglutathione lyase
VDLRFDCVFYYAGDLDRAVRFYSETLGLRLESRDAVARFQIDGVLFELVPAQDEAKLSGRGNARLTFEVDDVEAAARELGRRGVRVGDIVTVANGRLAPFHDTEGNELFLWQYAGEER